MFAFLPARMGGHSMQRLVFSLVMALATPLVACADVKLPPILSSHMVLQRETAVPIWGTAGTGEKVTVKFRDQQKEAKADKDGMWSVRLDPLEAGGPHTL